MQEHTPTPLFCLEDACLGYHDRVVVPSLDWGVHRGEHWAIVGPNGAGKTTLVRTLLGLLPLRGGLITYFDPQGQRTTTPPSLGYLPQINHIDKAFPIRVIEVIDFGLYGLSLDKQAREERSLELLEQVGLTAYAYQPIGRLSGGQLQRVLLARALAARPELVVLDEPMSFLDRSYKEGFEALLYELTNQETTILIVTHDLPRAHEAHWQTLPLGQW